MVQRLLIVRQDYGGGGGGGEQELELSVQPLWAVEALH